MEKKPESDPFEPSDRPRCLVVHRVECDMKDSSHTDHMPRSDFFDKPKLFAGDNKCSPLRGKSPILDLDDYLQENEDICIVAYRVYSCQDYHKQISDGFERVPYPGRTTGLGARMRSLLFVLEKDTTNPLPKTGAISLRSDALRKGLSEIERLSSNATIKTKLPTYIRSPYLDLYHSRNTIKAHIDSIVNSEQRAHVSALQDYISQELGGEFEEADKLFAKGLVSKEHFPKLFGPNEIVVNMRDGQPTAYISNVLVDIMGHSAQNVELECWSWGFDGVFHKEKKRFSVSWPQNASDVIEISKLEVWPLRYDVSGIEKRLRDRGKFFWECRKRKYVSYNAANPTFEIRTINPRFMIDMHAYYQMHPETDDQKSSQREEMGSEAMEREEPPEDPFIILLPSTILGYGFHDKRWKSLYVEYIEEINWNVAAFDRLVLPPNEKELIKALVTVHVATSASTDVIEGKGNGLIMLLHGGPGTGKTLTAESVAELTNKPLYRVTCGDMGTEPERVEKYLESVFYIGVAWGCVVLLDEADVFLEERTQADLQRNALVSVFLRAVEYYDGILILTTNRVGIFDEAFKSRIQLAIHYPPLDQEGRWEIWSNFINSLDEDKDDVKVKELKRKIDLLSRHKLNGRQIRNAVKTARQLAFYKKEKLDYSHFQRVMQVMGRFEKYLVDTHGHTDEEWAREERLRVDEVES